MGSTNDAAKVPHVNARARQGGVFERSANTGQEYARGQAPSTKLVPVWIPPLTEMNS